MNISEESFPPVILRDVDGFDLPSWAGERRPEIDTLVRVHGAVILRGFGIDTVPDFEAMARSLVEKLFDGYGDLPRESESILVYQSTPYPANKTILFHNESSHMSQWPSRQFFCCIQPAGDGGATPLVDGRQVYAALPTDLRKRFESVGIRYIRNFIKGLDVDWRRLFGTESSIEVERRCLAEGVECEWSVDGRLRTRQWAPAVIRHPVTREPTFFNQIFLHHPACLEPETREALNSICREDETAFPRCVTYGDGEPIADETIRLLRSIYDRTARRFSWERGDMVVVDNMLMSHGRDPFSGSRKVIVGMGDMIDRDGVLPHG